MATSFGWKHRRGSQSPKCSSSYNVWGKTGEGEMVGDRGMVTEEEDMLFI